MQNLHRILFLTLLFYMLYIKNTEILLLLLSLLWIVSYDKIFKLNKKVLKSILLFNAGVSIGYMVMGIIEGIEVWSFLIYINLKVYVLTYFVTLFFERIDIVRFFAFSKNLSFLLSISLSQIISYKKTFEDFRYAYRARVVKSLRSREKRFITTVFEFFLQKAMSDAKERTLAMKARGAF